MTNSLSSLQPRDEYNLELESHVHPTAWRNPTPTGAYQLVVIGAGTAGLVTAAGAAGLGARVALIERDLMGGDCLNVGCVPSKAIIRSARVAETVRRAQEFGISATVTSSPDEVFANVMRRMRRLRASISPHDSAARFQELGVDVYLGQAEFDSAEAVVIAGADGQRQRLTFRRAVIATGARAAAPNIPGLESVAYLTNESIFNLTELPRRLAIIGSGPIGSEMAQTFARLGSEVTLFERSERILPREDAEAATIIQQQMERDGVTLSLGSSEMRIEKGAADEIRICVQRQGMPFETTADQLLVAVGRKPNTDGLGLNRAGVRFREQGVDVNDYLQTTNPRIFAAGDICSTLKFTHAADFQARLVIQNALFAVGPFGRKKASDLRIPWAIYTTPELAHVGMNQETARSAGVDFDTYTIRMNQVDRARLDGQDEGFVKVIVKQGTDKILGATIVAEHAGDLISQVTLAMNNGLGLAKLGSTIHPYPTQAEAIRKLGDQFNRTRLTPRSKRLLAWLLRLNVGK